MKFNNETLKAAVKQWLNDASSAEATYGHISDWDTSGVNDMCELFKEANSFNQPIGNWDVSNVTDMSGMFRYAKAFNQPIGDWDVCNVTNMSEMFYGAEAFNQPIGNWDVSNVTDMSGMFRYAKAFNQPIGDWGVSNVTNMSYMFQFATVFNQPLCDWNVSNVTNMHGMFYKADNFNQPIGNWDVSSVTDMSNMFYNARPFNQPLGDWNVSNVTNMSYMFDSCYAFNQPLGDWDVSNVTNMSYMFDSLFEYNQPLVNWNVSNVTNMHGMFNRVGAFNQPIGDWNVGSVTDMSDMFNDANTFNQPLDNWNVSNVANMHGMFYNADNFNQPIGNWDVSKVTDMSGMFRDAKAFNQPIGNWDVSNVTNMSMMFSNTENFNQPIGNWNVSNVTDMGSPDNHSGGMFSRAKTFNQPIGNWNVSRVSNMAGMFQDALKFNQPIGKWDVSNVTNMRYMFYGAAAFNQSIENWEITTGTNVDAMLLRSNYQYGSGLKVANNKTYYENGNIKEDYEVNNKGNKIGYNKLFHKNGQLKVELNFTNGKQNDGTIISYHANGRKARQVILSKGNLNGDFTEWHENGNIKSQGFYDNDICSIEKEFDINGKLNDFNEIGFNDDQLKRAYEYWTENPEKAEVKYGHISSWDTSNVTDITEIYFKALESGIDISGWKLKFKENGLVFEKNKSGDFIVFHQNGKKRIQYSKVEFNDQYWYSNLESKFETTKDTKISIFDENETPLNEVTIFLTPNKGDSLIVFRTLIENYTKFHDGNFVETDFLSEYINRRKHIINLTGADELDLQKYPPVGISVQSQHVLSILANYIPEQKFILIFRWETINDQATDDVWDLPKEQQKFIEAYDVIRRTGVKKDEYGNYIDEEVRDFPGSKTMQLFGFEWIYDDDYRKYDYLRLYEEEVFNNLKVFEYGADQYDEDEIRTEPSLILDVEQYKRKLTFL